MLLANHLLSAALVLTGAPGTVGPLDAGLSAAQPRVDSRAAAPAEMGLARLRRVQLTVSGDPGRRVFLGLSTADQPTALAPLPGLVLGPQGLTWLADGLRDPSAVIGVDGLFRIELVVPDGLPLGMRMIAQAITVDPATGAHDVSPALDLRVEDVLEYRFDDTAAGWRTVVGASEVTPDGLTVDGPALLVRPLQGLEPGAQYRVEMTVGLGFDARHDGLRAGAASAAPTAAGSATRGFEADGATATATGSVAHADRRGRIWVLLESDQAPVVLDRAIVRLHR